MNNKKYQFKLLREEASKEDRLSDQTHSRIASEIYNLIQSEASGTTVGLEGGWGSGKSTIISILKEHIDEQNKNKDEDKIIYFYFDAWAHEGDPLRRIFLESLIQTAKEYKEKGLTSNLSYPLKCFFSFFDTLFDKDMRLEILEKKISNKMRVVTTTSSRTITGLGKWVGILTLLVPAGAAILSNQKLPYDFSDLGFAFSLTPHWTFWGLIFSFAPIILLLLNSFKLLVQTGSKVFESNNWKFLEGESTSEATQEVSEDEDRSSIEFEYYFKEILEILLPENSRNKLLIVIDNLDRIDAQDSLKIWSTLQTFLQHRNPYNVPISLYEKLWVIVPYDPIGLSKLWNKEAHKQGEIAESSKSFFDKCFQARLDVPKLILSGWEDFTRDQITKALISGWTNDELNQIIEMLIITRTDVKDIPTPRQIKTYINQIALLSNMYADKNISTKAIAYFVIYKHLKTLTREQIEKRLLGQDKEAGQLPEIKHLSLLPKSFTSELAGILFGVTPEKGQQLLLEAEIQLCLTNENVDEIKNLEKIHSNGFWIIFNMHLQRMQTDILTLLNYSHTIYSAFGNEFGKYRQFHDHLKHIVKGLEFPDINNLERYKALFTLLNWGDFDFDFSWNTLIKSFEEKFGAGNIINVKEAYEILHTLAYCITCKKITPITVNLPLEQWLQWAKENGTMKTKTVITINGIGNRLPDKTIPNAGYLIKPDDEFCNKIAEAIVRGNPLPSDLKFLIKYMSMVGFDNYEYWKPVIEKMKPYVSANNGMLVGDAPSVEVFEILNLLINIDSKCSKLINEITIMGSFYNLVFNLQSKDIVKYAALVVAKSLPSFADMKNIPVIGQSQAGIKLIEDYWKASETESAKFVREDSVQSNTNEFIWKLAEDKGNQLIGEVIKLAVEAKDSNFFKQAGAVAALAKSLYFIDVDFDLCDQVTEMFLNSNNIEKMIIENKDLDIINFSDALYYIVKDTTNKQELYKFLKGKLEAITKEQWDEAFDKDSYLTSLAIVLKVKLPEFILDNGYYESIKNFIESWISNHKEPKEWQIDYLEDLIGLLGASFQTHLKVNLGQYLLHIDFHGNYDAVYELRNFINFEKITTQEGREKIQRVMENSIKEEDFSTLKIIDLLLSNNNSEFDCDNHLSDILKKPIGELLERQTEEDTINMIKRLADKFKVNLEEILIEAEKDPSIAE